MDKQSPHLHLRVPVPDQPGLSLFEPTPRELKRWLAGLPKANIGETARQLYQSLTELNQLITPADNRLHLLELLRPEVHFVCRHLERHFLNQSIVLDERPRKVANLCQALQNHLAIGYKLVITQELAHFRKERAALLTAALQRASHSLLGPLVRASQLYCPVPEGLWLELHQLQRIARQHALQHVQVRDGLAHNGKSLSQEQTYLAALLLGCARCNQLRQNSIARLAEALEDWAPLVSLQTAEQPHSLFVIAPQQDGPPRYKSLLKDHELHNLLGLDPHRLVDAIKEHLLLPADGREAQRLPVPEGMSPDLLQHLSAAWGEISERTFQRSQGKGSLTLCIGMSAVHFFVGGQQSFNELLRRPEEPKTAQFNPVAQHRPDVWTTAFDAQPTSSWERGLSLEDIQYKASSAKVGTEPDSKSESYPLFELSIVNHSPGGYCLSWAREVPGQMQAGELLGVQDVPGQGWSVAVVRWIRQVRGGGTQMGIELIAPQAQACGLQLLRKSEQSSQYLRALLLPAIAAISRPATLLAPRLPFQEGNKVSINLHGQELRAILSRRPTSTGSFSQFEYRLLEQHSPVAGTAVTAQGRAAPSGEEDFDSLWKSL
ncbi:Cyclic-di-GMP receptor FimW [Pseudomonas sp. 8AS]|uniref:molecular chaperone n=1 Tax=Pseudomonas sp. 8AS TaxID=2653163 RepID=UPI0012F41826|nr:molecular chaperone [Pseudomonas sp. 8AS]VXB46399.1 Cyclic-di-GMP receptor FimW [Pseudomonas sp. 8AS]